MPELISDQRNLSSRFDLAFSSTNEIQSSEPSEILMMGCYHAELENLSYKRESVNGDVCGREEGWAIVFCARPKVST